MENEEPPPPPNHNSDPTDSDEQSLEKKRQAMLDRLSQRHQSRVDATRHRSSSESESISAFLSRFSASKTSIESQLAQCRLLGSTTQLKPQLDQISAAISDLEKLVAENSYFLPSYDVRSSLKSVSDLRQALDALSAALLPKTKFSFRNKNKQNPTTKPESPNPTPEDPKPSPGFRVPDSPGFWGKKDSTLVRRFEPSEVGEFTISELESCEVRLMGSVRALFVHNVKNCRVYTGPVTGSVLIDGAEGCVFVMASHQIRIHNAKRCDFYLRVRSRPIVEDSSGVRFGPYCLRYKGVDEELKEACLDEENENWANVDDFLWLRAVQSPNWSVLPEDERVGLIDISNSDEI